MRPREWSLTPEAFCTRSELRFLEHHHFYRPPHTHTTGPDNAMLELALLLEATDRFRWNTYVQDMRDYHRH